MFPMQKRYKMKNWELLRDSFLENLVYEVFAKQKKEKNALLFTTAVKRHRDAGTLDDRERLWHEAETRPAAPEGAPPPPPPPK
jgi:hypothetical protein